MGTQGTEADVFDSLAQGKFLKNLSTNISKDAKDSVSGDMQHIFNPSKVFDALEEALQESNADQSFVTQVQNLKDDPEVLKAFEHFEQSLEGKANITELHKVAAPPRAPTEEPPSGPTIDVGLNGLIFTGEVDEKGKGDLGRFSDYLAGSGSTFGGVVADLPSTLVGLSKSSVGLSMAKYLDLSDDVDQFGKDVDKIVKNYELEKMAFYDFTGKTPLEGEIEIATNPVKRNSVLKSALDKVKEVGDQKKQKIFQAQIKTAQLEDVKIKYNAKIKARKILQKVAGGVKGASGIASGAFGGVDVQAGSDVIGNAESLYSEGSITKEQYDQMMKEGKFRIVQGTFGIGDGINQIRELITKKVVKNAGDLVGSAKMAYRFGHAVGGAISIGAGVTSIAKNAMAASDAQESGNIGKAAVYGIMAGLDCVSVILDGASLVLDFVPGIGNAISFVLDVVNTLVNIVNMVLGFFADMIDTRTPQEKLQGALDEYVESAEFTEFLNKQANFYKDQGYDIFEYIVDAKAVGLTEEGADGAKADKTITRRLSENARQNFEDQSLRVALIDASSIGRELRGRCGDDIIRAGVGNDEVYGDEGDDLLFGDEDNDTMYGGPGNDYLHGGTGRDRLFGGAGDDLIALVPGVTSEVDGGQDNDTISIMPGFTKWMTSGLGGSGRVPNGIKGCYVDISERTGRSGLALGALVYGVANFLPHVHYPAFDSSTATLKSDLVEKFSGSGSQARLTNESLSNKFLWYLADITEQRQNLKIFTDGSNLFAVGRRDNVYGTWKESNFISSIKENDVITINSATNDVTCRKGKELEAWFFLAFKGTTVKGIERVTVSNNDNIRAQVIGNDKDNIIDIGNGGDAVVYTGEGNNVVVLKGNPQLQEKAARFIIGGTGQNTLVINQGRAYGKNYVLLEPDTDMSQAIKSESPDLWNGSSVQGATFVQGMKTIQCNINYAMVRIDATNQREGLKFIIDARSQFSIIGSQKDNSFYLKSVPRSYQSEIRGYEGKNYLSLEHLNPPQDLGIDLEEKVSIYSLVPYEGGWRGILKQRRKSSDISVKLSDIVSIRGNHRTLEMKGHRHVDNLFVANGGACQIETRGGSNTIVCMRGHQVVKGGIGNDTYVIHGPRISEKITVSVVRVETPGLAGQESGIKATTPIYGSWNWNTADLVLNFDHEIPDGIELTSMHIVGPDGARVSNKGSVQILDGKRYAKYKPQSHFNDLKVNESETIRISFETRGSHVNIHENSHGNRIEFKRFRDTDIQLQVNGRSKALEFRTSNNELILIDSTWGRNFNSGMSNIGDLCFDFAKRFVELKFVNNTIDGKHVFAFLWSHLSHLMKALNDYDNIIDARSLPTPVNLGNGNNVLLARRKKSTYITGEGSDIIDISAFDAPTKATGAETKVLTGRGDDLVVVGMNNETVKIQFAVDGEPEASGTKILVIKDAEVNAFRVSKKRNGHYELGENPPFVSFDVPPNLIVFDLSSRQASDFAGETIIVNNVEEFLERRTGSSDYWKYRMVFNSAGHMYIRAPYTYYLDELKLEINVENDLPEVSIRNDYDLYYKFEMDMSFDKAIRAQQVADAILRHCKAGIKLRRSTVRGQELREGIIDLFSRKRYQIVGAEPKAVVIDKSNTRVSFEMDKRYVQVEPLVRNAEVEAYVSLLFMPGRTSASTLFTGLNKQPATSGSSQREIWVNGELVCRLSDSPHRIVFRESEHAEYEIILRPEEYMQTSLQNSYVSRLFATTARDVYLNMTDFNSSEISVEVSASSGWYGYLFNYALLKNNNTEVYRVSGTNMNHGRQNSRESYMQNDAQDQGLEFASWFPGGIRYRDKTVKGGELTRFFATAVKSQIFGGRPYNKTLESDEEKTEEFLRRKATTLPTSNIFNSIRKLARSIDIKV